MQVAGDTSTLGLERLQHAQLLQLALQPAHIAKTKRAGKQRRNGGDRQHERQTPGPESEAKQRACRQTKRPITAERDARAVRTRHPVVIVDRQFDSLNLLAQSRQGTVVAERRDRRALAVTQRGTPLEPCHGGQAVGINRAVQPRPTGSNRIHRPRSGGWSLTHWSRRGNPFGIAHKSAGVGVPAGVHHLGPLPLVAAPVGNQLRLHASKQLPH